MGYKMIASKVLGWILLILLAPVFIGLMIFVSGWHIWEIGWASGSDIINLEVSLAVFIVVALSLTITIVRKGLSLVRLKENGVRSKKMGWFLSTMGIFGIVCSVLGVVEVHPYYFLPLLVSMMMIVLGLGMVYPRSLIVLRTIAGWSFFVCLIGAIVYVVILFTNSEEDWGIWGIGFQLGVGICALYPWIIVIGVWWFNLGVRRREKLTAHIQPHEPTEKT